MSTEESDLVELQFFTQTPDYTQTQRFSDTRKSQFVRQVYSHESRARERPPTAPTTQTTKPAPTFAFRDDAGEKHLVPPLDAVPSLPYHAGPGPCDGSCAIFARFDFNRCSTALASSVYGSFHERGRVPLHHWNAHVKLDELMDAHRRHIARDDHG